MAQLKPYDFILMDIHMPKMDGFEATKHIRLGKGVNQHTPIFALTADIYAKDNKQYHSYFSGFLNKPFEVDKIQSILMKTK